VRVMLNVGKSQIRLGTQNARVQQATWEERVHERHEGKTVSPVSGMKHLRYRVLLEKISMITSIRYFGQV